MKDWWPRIVILLLLGLILGVPFVFHGLHRARAAAPAAGAPRLVIVSPHNEQIRYEFAAGFNRWRVEQGLEPVVFDWRSGGGTSDLRKQVLAEFANLARQGREDQGIGYDLFFGGGVFEHDVMLAGGVEAERDGKSVRIPVIVPLDLPEGMLETVFPSPEVGGEPLYDDELRWVGVALSSFGIVYNRDGLRMYGLEEPRTWADLTDGGYYDNIALADPAHSGSIAAAYNTILQRMGWERGWATLRRVFANSRYFTASAGKVPVDVSAGEAVAGMCIDFYGRYQAGAIPDDRLGYVDPPGMTAITADPISLLRGAPNSELANQFVIWLLTPEGQALWQRRRGVEGGPMKYELRRLPTRRDLYVPEEMAQWADQVDPFEIARPLPPGTPDYYGTVGVISHAIAIDIHDDLKAAWRALLDHPDHPRRAEMEAHFNAMPSELVPDWPDDLRDTWETILADPDHPRHAEVAEFLNAFRKSVTGPWSNPDRLLADRLRWTKFFRKNYREVVRLAGER